MDKGCRAVILSEFNRGCGIAAENVLDSIMDTPASQTEVVSHLVEMSSVLKIWRLPDLSPDYNMYPATDQGRRLMQAASGESQILEVDDELDTSGSMAVFATEITGTGSEDPTPEVPKIEQNSTPETSEVDATSPTESLGAPVRLRTVIDFWLVDEVEAKASETSLEVLEEQRTVFAGSLSFDVSSFNETESQPAKEEIAFEENTLAYQINAPLVLPTPYDHLVKANTSKSVSVDDIMRVINPLVSMVEESPPNEEVSVKLFDIARDLDIIRFKLDSHIEEDQSALLDELWWNLQTTAQFIDSIHLADQNFEASSPSPADLLLDAVKITEEVYSKSVSSKDLSSLKKRLQKLIDPSEKTNQTNYADAEQIRDIDDLVKMVANIFNSSLHEVYPLRSSSRFSLRYNQSWTVLHLAQNQKWHAIRTVAASDSLLGMHIGDSIKGLYLVHQGQDKHPVLPYLNVLQDLVDDMVGVLSATHADKYKADNLPLTLESKGLTLWQRGPQITLAVIDECRKKAIQQLQDSVQATAYGFLPASDKVISLLEATYQLIDAKINQSESTAGIPVETAILLSMEAAMDVVTDWNTFANLNGIEDSLERKPFGRSELTNYVLALTGCLILGEDSDGQCRDIDRSNCHLKGMRKWNNTIGDFDSIENNTVCAPVMAEEGLGVMFGDILEESLSDLIRRISDLYLITAYCPSLLAEECKEDERCDLAVNEHRLVCRPASNFINSLVEVFKLPGIAAVNDGCKAYFELPTCRSYKSQEDCIGEEGCFWTSTELALNGSREICVMDWAAHLKLIDREAVEENNRLNLGIHQCQSQTSEPDCSQYRSEETDNYLQETLLPTKTGSTPTAVAMSLSVGIAILVAIVIYSAWRIFHRPSRGNGRSDKKGKGKKKGDNVGPPLKNFPMFSHNLDDNGVLSKKGDDFAFVMEAIKNEHSFTRSNSKSFNSVSHSGISSSYNEGPSQFASSTAQEISEIQPASEEDYDESSESDEEIVGWTSESEEYSDDDYDGTSLPDIPT